MEYNKVGFLRNLLYIKYTQVVCNLRNPEITNDRGRMLLRSSQLRLQGAFRLWTGAGNAKVIHGGTPVVPPELPSQTRGLGESSDKKSPKNGQFKHTPRQS